jgi:hypothetical protein
VHPDSVAFADGIVGALGREPDRAAQLRRWRARTHAALDRLGQEHDHTDDDGDPGDRADEREHEEERRHGPRPRVRR